MTRMHGARPVAMGQPPTVHLAWQPEYYGQLNGTGEYTASPATYEPRADFAATQPTGSSSEDIDYPDEEWVGHQPRQHAEHYGPDQRYFLGPQ